MDASPFNPIKLELAVIFVVGALLLLAIERVTSVRLLQFLLLLGYASLCTGWLGWRIRRVLQQHATIAPGEP